MAKFSFSVLLLLTINGSDYFAMGQSTARECSNDEPNKYYSDALFALANSIRSEFQNLKTQISGLENRVERQTRSG